MIRSGENNVVIFTLNDSDIESAIRQFICSCHPDMATGYVVNPTGDERIKVDCQYVAEKN